MSTEGEGKEREERKEREKGKGEKKERKKMRKGKVGELLPQISSVSTGPKIKVRLRDKGYT